VDGYKISLKYVIDNLCDHIVREGHRINFEVDLVHYHDLDARNKIIAIILENLAENAIHFAKDGLADIAVKMTENNRELNILFEDRGIGIEETFFKRIFDMYFRGSELSKGNGLGLYVVKTGVEKLNGKIHLESKRNDFTRFEINFPTEQL
jgi:signal transduction histidine kinase